jgi:hypothetical protein
MKGDFYPTDSDDNDPTPGPSWLWLWIVLVTMALIYILVSVGHWVFSWVFAPALTLPAGACVAPLCALIFRPRFVANVMDTEGNRVHTAYPYHDLHVKPEPIHEEGRVLYETSGSTWRGNQNQRTFIVYAFQDTNGNWVHCGNLDG